MPPMAMSDGKAAVNRIYRREGRDRRTAVVLLETAIKLHQLGRVDEAEQVYRRILVGQPNHPGALHLLGVIRQQQGRHEEALGLIGRAIKLKPDVAVYHNNYCPVQTKFSGCQDRRFLGTFASTRRFL